MPKIHGTHYKLAQQMVIRNMLLLIALFVLLIAICIGLVMGMAIDWICRRLGINEPFAICKGMDDLTNSDNMDGYEY
jgi:hypothetical protein